MGYHIYTTEGIILKRTTFGEANILVHVLTEDLGLIIASARSARLGVSKLRPALQEYTHVSISCIKAKNGWKITNVADKGSFFFGYPEYSHRFLSQISVVLMKMITGESPHKEIFGTVKSGFQKLKVFNEEQLSDLEVLMVIRILYELGYVVKNDFTEKYLVDLTDWSVVLINHTQSDRLSLVPVINKALKESQL
ncbi:MAG: recombination protein O N-terminal domain-containing protein [Parcubacteria group bacterium]